MRKTCAFALAAVLFVGAAAGGVVVTKTDGDPRIGSQSPRVYAVRSVRRFTVVSPDGSSGVAATGHDDCCHCITP